MTGFDETIGGLPGAPLPALGTDYAITSRDGIRLNVIQLRNWPLSNPVLNAINTKVAPSDLATINGQSLIQPGGNIVIATGGTATWGGITGNLSDQTDLQNALKLKVNASALATVATTGVYADLSGRPTLGTAAAANVVDFATAAQGAKADSALQPASIGVTVQAFDADTAKTDIAQTFTAAQRGGIVALTDAATITPDFALGNFYSVTLAGNRTLANPTNLVPGQSGSIFITQDATGSRTLAYGSFWDFAGGVAPILSTAANAVDRLDYVVRTTGSIHAVLTRAWS